MQLVPKSFFLTHGIGVHRERLTAFELALREADIEQQNLVTISSILPPSCTELERQKGVATLLPGEITFTVVARAETNKPGRRVHSSIGLARPSEPSMYGYISEHHGYGMTGDQSGEYAEDLAASMLASTLGIEFDPGRCMERAQAGLRNQQPDYREHIRDGVRRGRRIGRRGAGPAPWLQRSSASFDPQLGPR